MPTFIDKMMAEAEAAAMPEIHEVLPPAPANMKHDEMKERILDEYFRLPPLKCRFCKYESALPTRSVERVVTEHRHGRFRADIAALDGQGQILGVVEVVYTCLPSERTLSEQSALPAAFYVTADSLDSGFEGYCSPYCWTNRGNVNSCPLLDGCTWREGVTDHRQSVQTAAGTTSPLSFRTGSTTGRIRAKKFAFSALPSARADSGTRRLHPPLLTLYQRSLGQTPTS